MNSENERRNALSNEVKILRRKVELAERRERDIAKDRDHWLRRATTAEAKLASLGHARVTHKSREDGNE